MAKASQQKSDEIVIESIQTDSDLILKSEIIQPVGFTPTGTT